MRSDQKATATQVFLLGGLTVLLITLVLLYALHNGEDGVMVASGVAAMAAVAAGVSGFTIGKILK